MIREEITNIKAGRKELRDFGLLVGGIFLLLGAVLFWRQRDAYPYLLALGGALMGMGLLAPGALRYPYRAWMTLAVLMGWVMTHIIISLLFFLVITPISAISRIFGARYLDTAWRKGDESYWVRREKKKSDPLDHEKQY